jgi:hypothetical protein
MPRLELVQPPQQGDAEQHTAAEQIHAGRQDPSVEAIHVDAHNRREQYAGQRGGHQDDCDR